MNNNTRDLLILFRKNATPPQEVIEKEVGSLHRLLFNAENLDNFVNSHELIDVNKYTVTNNRSVIKKALKVKKEKPFIFLYNKN